MKCPCCGFVIPTTLRDRTLIARALARRVQADYLPPFRLNNGTRTLSAEEVQNMLMRGDPRIASFLDDVIGAAIRALEIRQEKEVEVP